jgi:hypothetical protein
VGRDEGAESGVSESARHTLCDVAAFMINLGTEAMGFLHSRRCQGEMRKENYCKRGKEERRCAGRIGKCALTLQNLAGKAVMFQVVCCGLVTKKRHQEVSVCNFFDGSAPAEVILDASGTEVQNFSRQRQDGNSIKERETKRNMSMQTKRDCLNARSEVRGWK